MAIYRYEAVDRTGKVVHGAMDAANEQALAQRLSTLGYALKAVVPAQAPAQQPKRAAQPPRAATPGGFPVSVEPCVSFGSLARFYRQLAILVRSGMPLIQALSELEGSTRNGRLRRACGEMQGRVQSGDSLSSAMATYPHLFPVHTVGLIWGGEQGGYLDVALDEAASDVEQEAKDNRLASIGWIIAKLNLFFFILSFPLFDFGGLLTLSMTTEGGTSGVLHAMAAKYAQGFVRYCIPSFVAWFGGAFAWKRIKRLSSVRRALDGVILVIPAWGTMHKEWAKHRFLRTLFQQYHAGVTPSQAWSAASMSVRNSEIASRLRGCEAVMRQPGGTLQQAFAQSGVFSMDDSGMVGSGERSGSIPEMLDRLSSYHADAAISGKNKGRMAAIHALILSIIIPTGIMLIMMASGYRNLFNFVFKQFMP